MFVECSDFKQHPCVEHYAGSHMKWSVMRWAKKLQDEKDDKWEQRHSSTRREDDGRCITNEDCEGNSII